MLTAHTTVGNIVSGSRTRDWQRCYAISHWVCIWYSALITVSTSFHQHVYSNSSSPVCSDHAGSVEVLRILGKPVEGQEGVGVSRRTVTQPVAFCQQAVVPHHLPALHRVIQVLGHAKHLKPRREDRKKRKVCLRRIILWSRVKGALSRNLKLRKAEMNLMVYFHKWIVRRELGPWNTEARKI